MASKDSEKAPLRYVVEASAYFLSGLFIITTTIVHVSGNDVPLEVPATNIMLAIGSWLTLFIGSILTLAGFYCLASTLFKSLEKFFSKYEKWLFAFLFATSSIEIAKRVFELWNIKLLFGISIAFLLLLLIIVVLKSKSVFNNIGQLLSISTAMLVMVLFALFSPSQLNIRWDLLAVIIITVALIIRASSIYSRKPATTKSTTKVDDK